MEMINENVFHILRIAKEIADGEYGASFLQQCGNLEADTDDSCDIVEAGISSMFSGVYHDYNSDIETESLVLFDPLIDELFHLCALYEEREGVGLGESGLRMHVETALLESLAFSGYSYDYGLRICGTGPGRKRLVLLTGMEFCGHDELPVALARVRETLEEQVWRLRDELDIGADGPMEQEAA